MTRLAPIFTTVIALVTAPGAFAHVAAADTAHVHAGDLWGVLAVAALGTAAAWLGRRGR